MHHLLLQNDRAHQDLVTKLANIAAHDQGALQLLNTLYDGTPSCLQDIPNIQMFCQATRGGSMSRCQPMSIPTVDPLLYDQQAQAVVLMLKQLA